MARKMISPQLLFTQMPKNMSPEKMTDTDSQGAKSSGRIKFLWVIGLIVVLYLFMTGPVLWFSGQTDSKSYVRLVEIYMYPIIAYTKEIDRPNPLIAQVFPHGFFESTLCWYWSFYGEAPEVMYVLLLLGT